MLRHMTVTLQSSTTITFKQSNVEEPMSESENPARDVKQEVPVTVPGPAPFGALRGTALHLDPDFDLPDWGSWGKTA